MTSNGIKIAFASLILAAWIRVPVYAAGSGTDTCSGTTCCFESEEFVPPGPPCGRSRLVFKNTTSCTHQAVSPKCNPSGQTIILCTTIDNGGCCGNGVLDAGLGEDSTTCCADAGCPAGQCCNTTSTGSSCGSCGSCATDGNACPPPPDNCCSGNCASGLCCAAGEVNVGGICCAPGQVNCSGVCVTQGSSCSSNCGCVSNNCSGGLCCPAGQVNVGGICCAVGKLNCGGVCQDCCDNSTCGALCCNSGSCGACGCQTPAITSLLPTSKGAGGAAFTLTVNGANFVNGSVVNWNGSPRVTTYINTNQLTAAILSGDIAAAGTYSITVTNPAPCSTVSPPFSFNVTAAACGTVPTTYTALYRSTRRGQTTFNTTNAPGDNSGASGWGAAFTTYNDATTFGSFGLNTGSISSRPSPMVYNSATSGFLARTGVPAHLVYPNNSYIQVGDPTSQPIPIQSQTGLNPTDITSLAQVSDIAGKDSFTGSAITWPVMIMVGPYQFPQTAPFASFTPTLKGPISDTWANKPWNLFQSPNPPTPASPPQPCTGGNCDTDELTVPHNVIPTGEVDYGIHPDQYTPYATLETPTASNWVLVNGHVKDGFGNSLPAIPVAAIDMDATRVFNDFEKTTDANGNFAFLIPGSAKVTFQVNNSTPMGSNTVNTHYYDPHYIYNNTKWTNVQISSTVPGAVKSLGSVVLSSVTTSIVTGIINGTVTSVESGGTIGLAGIPLELRNANGYVLLTTTTNVNGNYSFGALPANSYYVTPVTQFHEVAVPYKSSLINLAFNSTATAQPLQLRNAPALVTATSIYPGAFMYIFPRKNLKYSIGTYGGSPNWMKVTKFPAPVPMNSNFPIYSTVIPGGPGGGTFTAPIIPVLPGNIYDYFCWYPTGTGASTIYQNVAVTRAINSGAPLDPDTNYTVGCP